MSTCLVSTLHQLRVRFYKHGYLKADVARCASCDSLDLSVTEFRWTPVISSHTQSPLSPPPILVIKSVHKTQLLSHYFLGLVGSVGH